MRVSIFFFSVFVFSLSCVFLFKAKLTLSCLSKNTRVHHSSRTTETLKAPDSPPAGIFIDCATVAFSLCICVVVVFLNLFLLCLGWKFVSC